MTGTDPMSGLTRDEINDSLVFAWHVNDTLHEQTRLADAKAAAIVAFTAALFVSLAARMSASPAGAHPVSLLMRCLMATAMGFFLLAGLFALIAILPRMRRSAGRAHVAFTDLLVHGSIQTYVQSYHALTQEQRLEQILESNYAISSINRAKFRLITLAVGSLLLGIVAAGLSVLIHA